MSDRYRPAGPAPRGPAPPAAPHAATSGPLKLRGLALGATPARPVYDDESGELVRVEPGVVRVAPHSPSNGGTGIHADTPAVDVYHYDPAVTFFGPAEVGFRWAGFGYVITDYSCTVYQY